MIQKARAPELVAPAAQVDATFGDDRGPENNPHRLHLQAELRREKTRERVRRHRAAKKQAQAIEFVRSDSSLFLHPDRLSQKAGVPKHLLRRMAIKELVDNALDVTPNVTLTEVNPDEFVIQDDGPGIAPKKVTELFSVTRPMMSTKLVRRPTRGMVGNGLRVATGAAFASAGSLTVESRGVRQELSFDPATGETVVATTDASGVVTGTRVTIRFGDALPRYSFSTLWGHQAIRLAGPAAKPMLSHPEWYEPSAFKELVAAARGTAQDLADLFGVDLCNASRSGGGQGQSGDPVRYIDPDAPAADLDLDTLRALAPKPPKLLPIAEDAFPGAYRGIESKSRGIPVIVQTWAKQSQHARASDVTLIVNRTPTVADMAIYAGSDGLLRGCGLYRNLGRVPKAAYHVTIAVTSPVVALISDGKTPDLSPFSSTIASAVGSAMRRAHKPTSRSCFTIKEAAFSAMEAAYEKASAGGTLPANARQIMYAARPSILQMARCSSLNDAYFTQTLLPAFIEANPETTAGWDVVYDARGHLVEPHTDHSVPLGT